MVMVWPSSKSQAKERFFSKGSTHSGKTKSLYWALGMSWAFCRWELCLGIKHHCSWEAWRLACSGSEVTILVSYSINLVHIEENSVCLEVSIFSLEKVRALCLGTSSLFHLCYYFSFGFSVPYLVIGLYGGLSLRVGQETRGFIIDSLLVYPFLWLQS